MTTGPVHVECPSPVDRPAMVQHWDQLTFLHWSFEPEVVGRLLPSGLEIETFDGRAWVGLVPFFIRVALPHTPPVPWLSMFAETNVRTYVIGPNGETGVWFFSLDAARLGAVVTARSTYRLPYFWSQMQVGRAGPVMTYRCRRRWPGPRHASSEVAVEIGDPYGAGELTTFDHWLTARWTLFSHGSQGIRFARADHPVWPLHRATALHVDDELMVAAGLPTPTGEPLAHWAPTVPVRIGLPISV